MKNPDLAGRAKIGFEEYDLCKYCIFDIKRFINQGKADRKTENSSEKPNNCEHITEDGVTCAKYPACDDCLDNPLNKVKGSEEETEIERLDRIDSEIEDAWARVRELTPQTEREGE